MTRNWTNYSATSGLTPETRAHIQQLEADLATGVGIREEVVTVGFADVNAHAADGLVPLVTLAARSCLVQAWVDVTAAFNDSTVLDGCDVVKATDAAVGLGASFDLHTASTVLHTVVIGSKLLVSAAAAAPLAFLANGNGSVAPTGDGTTGSVNVHLLIAQQPAA